MDLNEFYAGNPAALTAVYRNHIDKVERAVSSYCRGVEAECVIHDVFLSLIEKPEMRQQFTGGDMGAWLTTIAKRRAIDALRRNKKWQLLDDPRSLEGHLPPINDEESLLHQDQIQHLQAALNLFAAKELPKLGEKLSQIYELRFKEGQSQKESARRLNIPRATCIDREQRLMKRIGQFLKQHFFGRA